MDRWNIKERIQLWGDRQLFFNVQGGRFNYVKTEGGIFTVCK